MTYPVPAIPGPLLDSALVAARHAAGGLLRWSMDRVLPDGGQGTARRNAWIAMGAEARHRRDRAEADAALAWAARRSASLAVHPAQGAAGLRPVIPGTAGVAPTV
jgi:hypothetical protein